MAEVSERQGKSSRLLPSLSRTVNLVHDAMVLNWRYFADSAL